MFELYYFLIGCILAGAAFAIVYAPVSQLVRWHLAQRERRAAQMSESRGPQPDNVLSVEQARQLLNELCEVAQALAGDVRLHTNHVTRINEELLVVSREPTAAKSVLVRVIKELVDANRNLECQLVVRTQLIEQQHKLLQGHLCDPLTGIPTRGTFDYELSRRLLEWNERQATFCLLLIDLDEFKKINDTFGHQAGDLVISEVARLFRQGLRDVDAPARYGGDEFAALVPGQTLDDALQMAERIRLSVASAAINYEKARMSATASLGVAQVGAGDNAESIFRRADQALYAAKRAGSNRVYYHTGTECLPFGLRPTTSGKVATEQAETDSVTRSLTVEIPGIPNRTEFMSVVRRRLAQWQRDHSQFSVVVLGFDQWDSFHRLYGNRVAGLALSSIPPFLTATFRDMDTVARFEDREFAVLMPSCGITGAARAAERVRQSIAQCEQLQHQGQVLRLAVSCGVAEVQIGDDSVSLLDRARTALHSAQSQGGNRAFLHDGRQPLPVRVASPTPITLPNANPDGLPSPVATVPPTSG